MLSAASGRSAHRRTYTAPVSDTTNKPPLSLNKGRGGDQIPAVARPRTITAAVAAVGAVIVLSIAEAASLFGFTDQLSKLLADNNAKAKKPKSPYGPSQISHDLHQFRITTLVQAIVVGLALIFLIFALRRVRTASVGRWALVIVMVLTNGPVGLIPVKGLPGLPNALRVLTGVASLAAIVLLFMPESSRYFRACKATLTPEGAPPRASLRDLFAPRPPARAPESAKAAAPQQPAKASVSKAKGKSRVDEAAVAKGAELARNRAKASKSRRTES